MRYFTKSIRWAKAKRALELKELYPYLTWGVIAKRVGVYDSSHLHKIIKDYKGRNEKTTEL